MNVARGHRLVRILWLLVVLVVAVLVTKFFVADVYRISSGSMRPTILGGAAHEGEVPFTEWVLVRYGRGDELRRFDLVVMTRPGEDPVVKRIAGLPGESVLIDGGDLLIDGKRLAADVPRPEPIIVFDDAHLPVDDYFEFKGAPDGPWRHLDDRWVLDASEVKPRSNGGMLFYQPEIRDDYLDQERRRVVGRRTVSDAIVECEFAIDHNEGRLRFQLVEKADTFEALIYPNTGEEFATSHVVEIVRMGAHILSESTDQELSLGRIGVELAAHTWADLCFSNIDNHLRVRVGPDVTLTADYEANELFPGIAPNGDQSVGPRVGLGGEGMRARFRSIRVSRDLHYTSFPSDGYAVEAPVWLADDEVFLLGDNSAVSTDSRRFGPVSIEDLAGRPLGVVWPYGRIRGLTGTVEE